MRAALELDSTTLVLRLTALMLLLFGGHGWAMELPLTLLCAAALLVPSLLTSRRLWLMCSLTLVLGNAADWTWIDNHKYLITYWTMACTLAVASDDPASVLARHGRVLICIVFTLAVVWKLAAGEYLDGAFFHLTLLTDERLAGVAGVLGGLDPGVLANNRAVAGALALVPDDALTVELVTSPRLRITALVASYWTLLIEAAIAVSFIPGVARRVASARHWLLMAFVVTTYPVVPVLGFGFVLTVMGLSQTAPTDRRVRAAYLSLLVVMQLGRIPWQQAIGG